MPGVWEPFFGDASRIILKGSALSHLLPLPDAALGAGMYFLEAVSECVGGRWRTTLAAVFATGDVAAALVLTAHHYRREWYVGGPTAAVITANKFVPGYGDRYLARNGYEAQMRDGHEDPDRPNLDHPGRLRHSTEDVSAADQFRDGTSRNERELQWQ